MADFSKSLCKVSDEVYWLRAHVAKNRRGGQRPLCASQGIYGMQSSRAHRANEFATRGISGEKLCQRVRRSSARVRMCERQAVNSKLDRETRCLLYSPR